MGFGRLEYGIEQAGELRIRRIVGPHPEDTAGMELVGEVSKRRHGVESAVLRIEPMTGE